MNIGQREEAITLQSIGSVEQQSDDTPSHLAGRMRLDPGFANSYLGRCVRKGPLETKQAPANRHLNHLTSGIAEKPRLMGEYLSCSVTFSRRPPESLARLVPGCLKEGKERIVLYGASCCTALQR